MSANVDLKKFEALMGRLELITQRQEAIHSQKPGLAPKPATLGTAVAGGGNSTMPPVIKAYDDNLQGPIKSFLDVSKKIGGEVAQMAEKVGTVFDLHRNFLWQASGQPEPDSTAQQKILGPIVHQMGEIRAFTDAKKSTKVFNHLAAVAEGLLALGWVSVKPTPGPHVKEMLDVSMFYVNRVRTEHKGGDKVHGDWAKAWCEIFGALQAYIKQWHTTGLVWNSAPGSQPPSGAGGGKSSSKGSSPAPGGGPPPPPPPPTADFMADLTKGGGGGDKDGRQALFSAINKGEAITSGLKKVTAEMQTHKNPNLRAASTVPANVAKSPISAGGQQKAGALANHPPKLELKDQKVWQIEYHKNNRQIQVQVDMKQSVYIYRCENSVVQIKGKVNSVTVDSCKKTSIVFDSLLSQIELINCQSIEVQTMGALPTISIQKTDGCQVYLSKEAIGTEIVTSKSSEMNILVPKGNDGDFMELPVPEQFKTTFDQKTKKLVTVVSDIA